MVAKTVQKKFGNWKWKCLDCEHEWSSEFYECPKCHSLNTERKFD